MCHDHICMKENIAKPEEQWQLVPVVDRPANLGARRESFETILR